MMVPSRGFRPYRRVPVSTDKRFRTVGGGDHGTAERWRHSGFTVELTERAGIVALRAVEEHLLDVLKVKRVLDTGQCAAGFRLKEDYQAAALEAHVTGSYSGVGRGRDFFWDERERTDAQEDAYRRWRAAVHAMGRVYGAAVIDAVCYDRIPANLAALQKGLSLLASWYARGQEASLQAEA
ncbi:MAG: DUF6456 domain-containing protein [Alphaproteobacteria bacterium]|nr:DUF6456 domain-containing protein [Alphaproteobacteria bacterium]